MKKLNNKGETLVETLISIMIIAIVIAGFSSVVSNVIKANNSIKNMRNTFNYDGVTTVDTTNHWSIVVTAEGDNGSNNADKQGVNTGVITKYIDNGLYYYER